MDERHDGALARYEWYTRDRTLTMEQALVNRETELGRPLNITERRQFFKGWRMGLAVQSANNLIGVARYLNRADLEALGADLFALAQKYGVGKTIAEMKTHLVESKSPRHDDEG